MFKHFFLHCLSIIAYSSILAQSNVDSIYNKNIKAVRLIQNGTPLSYPIIALDQIEGLRLDFDYFTPTPKNIHYTFQLCDAQWNNTALFAPFYLKGFSQGSIKHYEYSSSNESNYIHYQILLPQHDCLPQKSGNYLLKVFENGDTAQLLFSKRVLIVSNNSIPIEAHLSTHSFANNDTHQKVHLSIHTQNIPYANRPAAIKVAVLQNFRWDNARLLFSPSFIRNNTFEYDTPLLEFEAGREYRWIDITNFNLWSERVKKIYKTEKGYSIEVHTDIGKQNAPYLYRKDYNGNWNIKTTNPNKNNAHTQGDYAHVLFSFQPFSGEELPFHDIYLLSRYHDNKLNNESKMYYNASTQTYQLWAVLKEGFYSYTYIAKEKNAPDSRSTFSLTESNHWETENDYIILVYYRQHQEQYDQLIGYKIINTQKP